MVVDQGQTLGRSEISRKQVQGWPTLSISCLHQQYTHTETPTTTKYHTLHITEGELVNLAEKMTDKKTNHNSKPQGCVHSTSGHKTYMPCHVDNTHTVRLYSK